MTTGYRLVSYVDQELVRAGVVVGNRLYPAADLLGSSGRSVLHMLRDWDLAAPRLEHFAVNPTADVESMPLVDARLLAPILHPGAFFCAGANYWDHLEEMAEVVKLTTGAAPTIAKGAEPWFFVKTTYGTIVGPGAPVRLPSFSTQVDWEAELGVVIGRAGRNIPEREALAHVAGYLIVNDLSARDHVRREGSPFIYDWIGQKCFDDAAPMGPWITPAAYVPDPHQLGIRLWLNDVLKQCSNTSQMVHGIAEQIAYLSRHVTLRPGDVIATGTPAGVGMPEGEFLKAGDQVRIEIDHLGTLTNRMTVDHAQPAAEFAHAD